MNEVNSLIVDKAALIIEQIRKEGAEPAAAIHIVPRLTKSGHNFKRIPRSLVVIGAKPFGPRGGSSGIWVNGKAFAYFDKFAEAEMFVSKLKESGLIR